MSLEHFSNPKKITKSTKGIKTIKTFKNKLTTCDYCNKLILTVYATKDGRKLCAKCVKKINKR